MERYELINGRRVYTASQRIARYCDLCFRMIFMGDRFIKQPGSSKVRHINCHRREARKNGK